MEDYDRFKRLCDAHGFSTRQVAKKIGADPSTFSHWKKGDYVPRYETRKAIAEFFGVNIEWIDEGRQTIKSQKNG